MIKRKIWYKTLSQTQIQEIVTSYKELQNCREVARRFGVDRCKIERLLRKQNIPILIGYSEKLSDAARQEICRLYRSGQSLRQVSDSFNIPKTSVVRLLKKQGVLLKESREGKRIRSGCSFSTDAFLDENDEAFAYWYGFSLADGCLSNKRICFTLARRDRSHLEKLKAYCKTSNNICDSHSTIKKLKKTYPVSSYYFDDDKTIEKFKALGFEARKSTKERVPDIYKNNPHFWRGFCEGDCGLSTFIAARNKEYRCFSLIASEFVMADFNILLGQLTGLDYFGNIQQKGVMKLQRVNIPQAKILVDWMYKDCTIYLDRKFEVYNRLWCKDDNKEK